MGLAQFCTGGTLSLSQTQTHTHTQVHLHTRTNTTVVSIVVSTCLYFPVPVLKHVVGLSVLAVLC